MKSTGNRDLLVLTKSFKMSQQELDDEVEFLHSLLYHAESMNVFCIANEIIDVNCYKIIHKPFVIWQTVRAETLKPFVFISNKN